MTPALAPDGSIILHVLLALALGWLLGYERYSQGRAAGTQVYCLVCIASSALTSVSGQSANLVGSILTGIGFLGAGIIVKSGTNIRGLTTAASVWSSAAVGILVGLGHYVAALSVTALYIVCMTIVPHLEHRFQVRIALEVSLRYRRGHRPDEAVVHAFLHERGLSMLADSLSVVYEAGCHQFRFQVLAASLTRARFISRVASELPDIPHVESFSIEQTNRA